METKITVVVDNTGGCGLQGEWGLSLLAEHNGKKILADAGASELFAKNLAALGHSIESIDYATLSHAHYDHANGMVRFFECNDKAKFYLRDAVREDCYAKKFIFRKYIGIPRHILEERKNRIEMVSGDYCLYDGAYLIPHKTKGLDAIGRRELMYRRTERGWQPDDFSHEQSLVLRTGKGLVIINCCCHGGTVNIIREVRETFPEEKVYALIGGFHLFNKSEREVRAVAEAINDTGIEYVCTGHCTKDRAFEVLKETLGEKLHKLQVGKIMQF